MMIIQKVVAKHCQNFANKSTHTEVLARPAISPQAPGFQHAVTEDETQVWNAQVENAISNRTK